jgi:hypothetical protein
MDLFASMNLVFIKKPHFVCWQLNNESSLLDGNTMSAMAI